MITPLTPLDFLARSAYTWRDRIAVVDGDRRFTYSEFAARVQAQAAALGSLRWLLHLLAEPLWGGYFNRL